MKRILSVVLIAVLVLGFSVFALGAKGRSEQDYIGVWGYDESRISVYPSHSGEWKSNQNYDGFTWTVDNGYLVVHTYTAVAGENIFTFLMNDDGDKLVRQTMNDSSFGNNTPRVFPKYNK